MKLRRPHPVLLALVFGLASFALYSGALEHGFIWDDTIVVKEQLPYFTGLSAAFFPPPGIPRFSPCYYRPLVLLSYEVDRALAGAPAGGAPPADAALARSFHRFNVIANALAAALVFLLGAALARAAGGGGDAYIPAGAGALLFAVHPVHVEAVAWIVGRADVLCALLLVGALALHLWSRRGGGLLASGAAALCSFGAMLAKETGVAVLALVPLLDLTLARGSKEAAPRRAPRQLAVGWGFVLLAGGIYAALRWAGLRSLGGRCTPAGAWRLDAAPPALGWSVLKALWPASLSPYVDRLPDGVLALVGWLFLALLALAAAMLATRRVKLRVEAYLALFFGASVAPALFVAASGILDRPVAERYLYAPTVALCLLVGSLVARAAEWGPLRRRPWRALPLLALALFVALPACRAVIARTAVFRDDVSFWSAAAAAAPESVIPRVQLGAALNNAGRRTEARAVLSSLWNARLTPGQRAMVATQLGNLSVYESRFADAVEFYRQSLASKPDQPGAHFNWGLAELQLARSRADTGERKQHVSEAIEQLTAAVRLNPQWVRARFELGRALLDSGAEDAGRRQLLEVLRLAPGGAEASQARALLARGGAPGNAPQ